MAPVSKNTFKWLVETEVFNDLGYIIGSHLLPLYFFFLDMLIN